MWLILGVGVAMFILGYVAGWWAEREPRAAAVERELDDAWAGTLHAITADRAPTFALARPPVYVEPGTAQGMPPAAPRPPAGTFDAPLAATAERAPTVAEIAEDAEYRLFWSDIQRQKENARAWYDDTFQTGQFKGL
jgi:hypothetical protein